MHLDSLMIERTLTPLSTLRPPILDVTWRMRYQLTQLLDAFLMRDQEKLLSCTYGVLFRKLFDCFQLQFRVVLYSLNVSSPSLNPILNDYLT